MIRSVATAAALLAAAAAAAAGQPAAFTVESHGTTATVGARPPGDPAGGRVTISISQGARSASWEYRNLFLDQESGAAPAEIQELNRRDYLFVRAHSGGAGCCWTLLVFDLVELRPLGAQLASQSPIELVRGKYGCELGAIGVPVAGRDAAANARVPPTLFCFDGRTLVRRNADVPAPFQAPGERR